MTFFSECTGLFRNHNIPTSFTTSNFLDYAPESFWACYEIERRDENPGTSRSAHETSHPDHPPYRSENCELVLPTRNPRNQRPMEPAVQLDWKTRCAARKQAQVEYIPPEWIIPKVPDTQLNVLDVPVRCGLLTPMEVEITETRDVGEILRMLHSAKWSSEDVTRAFYKRAIVAHQVVFSLFFPLDWLAVY